MTPSALQTSPVRVLLMGFSTSRTAPAWIISVGYNPLGTGCSSVCSQRATGSARKPVPVPAPIHRPQLCQGQAPAWGLQGCSFHQGTFPFSSVRSSRESPVLHCGPSRKDPAGTDSVWHRATSGVSSETPLVQPLPLLPEPCHASPAKIYWEQADSEAEEPLRLSGQCFNISPENLFVCSEWLQRGIRRDQFMLCFKSYSVVPYIYTVGMYSCK